MNICVDDTLTHDVSKKDHQRACLFSRVGSGWNTYQQVRWRITVDVSTCQWPTTVRVAILHTPVTLLIICDFKRKRETLFNYWTMLIKTRISFILFIVTVLLPNWTSSMTEVVYELCIARHCWEWLMDLNLCWNTRRRLPVRKWKQIHHQSVTDNLIWYFNKWT